MPDAAGVESLAARVRQIELSLQRLRWPADMSGGPFIAVNLPSFRLWAFKTIDAPPLPATRDIVGKTACTHMPVFTGTLRYIGFDPYWDVPPSTLHAEIVLAMLRDPNSLPKNDVEVESAASQTTYVATLAALRARSLRVRQYQARTTRWERSNSRCPMQIKPHARITFIRAHQPAGVPWFFV